MNRRKFLHATALAGSSLMTFHTLATDTRSQPKKVTPMRSVEVAMATICCDGFGDENFEPTFRLLPKIGVKNVEFNTWYPRNLTPAGLDSIKQRCVAAGVKPVCVQGTAFGDGKAADVAHKLWCLEAARILGCQRVKFTGSKRDTNGGLKAVISTLKEMAPAAEDMGMLVLVENHAKNVLESIEDYDAVFAAIDSPNVGLCLDTGHFEGAGVAIPEVIKRFHSRTLHLDLKDNASKGAYKTVRYGEGQTDLNGTIKALLAHGYTGYLLIEQAPPISPATLAEDLRKGYEMFRPYEKA